jgi:hypothetical protein
VAGGLDLSGDRLRRRYHWLQDGRIPTHRFQGQCGHEIDGLGDPGGQVHHQRGVSDGHPVGRDEREPILGFELQRGKPRSRQRLGPAHHGSPNLGAPAADGHQRDGGHVHEVGCAHRTHDRDDGVNAAVQHGHQHLRDAEAGSGSATSDPHHSNEHRGSNHRRRQGSAEPSGVHSDDGLLVLAEDVQRHPLVAKMTEAGVQTVDGGISRNQRVHHGPRRLDSADRTWTEAHLSPPGDPDDRLNGDGLVADLDEIRLRRVVHGWRSSMRST